MRFILFKSRVINQKFIVLSHLISCIYHLYVILSLNDYVNKCNLYKFGYDIFIFMRFRIFSSFSKSVLKPPSDKTLGDALKILDDFSQFSRNRTAWNQARDVEPVGLGRGGRGQPRSRSPNHYNTPGERPDGSRVYFQLPNGQLSNSRIEVE